MDDLDVLIARFAEEFATFADLEASLTEAELDGPSDGRRDLVQLLRAAAVRDAILARPDSDVLRLRVLLAHTHLHVRLNAANALEALAPADAMRTYAELVELAGDDFSLAGNARGALHRMIEAGAPPPTATGAWVPEDREWRQAPPDRGNQRTLLDLRPDDPVRDGGFRLTAYAGGNALLYFAQALQLVPPEARPRVEQGVVGEDWLPCGRFTYQVPGGLAEQQVVVFEQAGTTYVVEATYPAEPAMVLQVAEMLASLRL